MTANYFGTSILWAGHYESACLTEFWFDRFWSNSCRDLSGKKAANLSPRSMMRFEGLSVTKWFYIDEW